MFRLSPVIVLFPRFMWPYLPFWKKFVATWDHLFKVAEDLVKKKMEEIQENVQLDRNVEGAYLTHLLLSDQMTVTEILGSITELLLAGVDTVSNFSSLRLSPAKFVFSLCASFMFTSQICEFLVKGTIENKIKDIFFSFRYSNKSTFLLPGGPGLSANTNHMQHNSRYHIQL
uniref:Uncharacterized protein n=1 Tax=Stegastes partitus TaxID=144197 RepID=A0A3B4ZQF9_9TELE